MPVDQLLCEGEPKSPDVRLLNSLVANCVVRAGGSKYGLGTRILLWREVISTSTTAGIRDRDFDDDDRTPSGVVRDWLGDDGRIRLGFIWERKEIENYLIDPSVVRESLGLTQSSLAEYTSHLEWAADRLGPYTAARTALSLARPRFRPLPNSWGRGRGSAKHRLPDGVSTQECRDQIRQTLATYAGSATPVEDRVMAVFDQLFPLCGSGGIRRAHYLTFFSGKDILYSIQPQLLEMGLGHPGQFLERILTSLEHSTAPIGEWVPEWSNLQVRLSEFSD